MTARAKRGNLRKDKGRQQKADKLMQTKKDLRLKILIIAG